MSPSHLNIHYRSSYRKDFQRSPGDFEELNNAYSAGDYTTAIDFLNSLLTNVNDQVGSHEAREHVLLARVMCFQQMREHEQVVIDTTEVEKATAINGTSSSSVPVELNSSLGDHIFCRILALWLRSLALESLESWERAKNDLEALKTLILEKNRNNMIPFKTEGVLSIFLPHMTPLIAQYKTHSIFIDLRCVDDRQRRMKELVAKEISLRNNASQAFRLIDDDIESCDDLAKKFHYRLLLRRPLHPNIHVNMWYTLDLMFVSEMGLFKREDLIGIRGYALGCKLLEINADEEISDKYEVQVRPMSAESREWSDCTDADWAGVQNGGKGGLEFRVVHTNKQSESNGCITKFNGAGKSNISNGSLKSHPSAELYLYVYPIREVVDENYINKNDINKNENLGLLGSNDIENGINKESNSHLVPLSIGPIRIVSCGTCSGSCVHHIPSNDSKFSENNDLCNSTQETTTSVPSRKKSPWSIDDCLVDNYRSFILPNGKYLIVKELWDVGIPGKVWDSAFIIVQMIKDMILKDKNSFIGKRILDLSTGTGFVGLYLAAFLSTQQSDKSEEKMNNPKTNMILTDLSHALELIRRNLELNRYFLDSNNDKVTIDVEELRWGDLSKAKSFGVLDYVLASDVVYEPDLFDSLAQTLITVCTPGRTKIYLGYKRRGLNKDEETRFFDKLRNEFHISAVQGLGDLAEEGKVTVYELSRK